MVDLNSQFLFPLGVKIKDKEINDVRLVVGRVLDTDNHNQETYILKNNNGVIGWMTAETAHKHFTKFEV